MDLKIAKVIVLFSLPCLAISIIVIVLDGFRVVRLDHSLILWIGATFSACAFLSVAGAYVVLNDTPVDSQRGLPL